MGRNGSYIDKEIEDLLNDHNISGQKIFVGEYKFFVGEISEEITIKLYRSLENKIYVRQSHYIHTPQQAGPYITSVPWWDNEWEALNRVISSMTQYYDSAVRAGHQPKDNWLLVNTRFKNF